MKIKVLVFCFALSFMQANASQDTLKLTLVDAEKLFLQNNYQLLLTKYEIDDAEAEVVTQRLFDNPEITHENLFYNHETKRFLGTSYATGQFTTQISQLFKLARKRNKNINLAHTAVKLAKYEYYDLLRNLRYQLRTDFLRFYFLRKSATTYELQISTLSDLLQATEKQSQLGNIADKDVIRIKSLHYGLEIEYNQINNELADLGAELKLLLGIAPTAEIVPEITTHPNLTHAISYEQLLDTAKANRIDLKAANTNITYAQQYSKLQKANAVPDITLSLSYDLKGNYPEKYTGIGISMPIPLFNRNQGEIKKAKIGLLRQQTIFEQVAQSITNEVYNAYKQANRLTQLRGKIDQNFTANFKKLMNDVNINFQKRNIGLLEFLDFYESYKESTIQFHQLDLDYHHAKEKINFVIGTTLFK